MSDKLQHSYEKQELIFTESKEKKLFNVAEEIRKVDEKILSLQKHREKLEKDYENIKSKEFMSFVHFQSKSIVQSSVQKEDWSPDLTHLSPETQKEVLSMLKERKII